jgi:carboxynorspermidine decarboxylase
MDERLGSDLVELGRLQDVLAHQGQQSAEHDAAAWELFVGDLTAGAPQDQTVRRARDLASAAADRLLPQQAIASRAALWDYAAARILRAIRVDPAALLDRWHAIGRADCVPAPGDFLTARVVQEPVFILRGQDGAVRGFLNVCPHRSAELLTGQGRLDRGRIVCAYHGWCFDARGACVNAPGERRGQLGERFQPADWGLQALACAEASGWIHVAFGRSPAAAPPVPPAMSMPAAQRAARLVHAVHPGFPRVKEPEVSDAVRFHLRLGATAARLQRRLAGDARDAEVDCLRIELRQSLIDTGRDPGPWRALLGTTSAVDASSAAPALADTAPASDKGAARALPTRIYGDRPLFAAETARLIHPTWQFVGHERELTGPGDAVRLDVAGESIIVRRSAGGTLAAGVLREPWSRPRSGIDGPPDAALASADVDVWNGLIFVRLARGGPRVADVWEHPGLLVPYRIAEMEPLKGAGWYDFDVEVDYKLLWENFLELYHFPIAHRSLSRLFRVAPDSDLMPLRSEPSPECTPAERAYFDNLLASAPHSRAREEALRRQADEDKRLDAPLHFSVFGSIPLLRRAPITLGLTVFPDHLQAMSFVPIGPRECRVRIRSYGHPLDTGTDRGRALAAARQANIDVLQIELVEEDIFVNYRSEGGTGSRMAARPGILAGIEISVRDFQWSLGQLVPAAAAR